MHQSSLSKELLENALPDLVNNISLEGLVDSVKITRDEFGIPHIKAKSVRDVFFGQGFATAQDRLWHMDYDRLRAYGRWSECVGKSTVEQDKMMRRFQIESSVKDDYRVINSDASSMLDSYAEGVNAFINSTNSLPIEYEILDRAPDEWMPWDCLAVFKVRHILMGTFESKFHMARLINILGPEKVSSFVRGYQNGHLLIVPPGTEYDGARLESFESLTAGFEAIKFFEDIQSGSNNWALSGMRTESKKPLVAGDPHRSLDTPNVYYQNHISCDKFDVIGLSFPGCPGFPHFGHNKDVAWCVTHAGTDYQDLYLERFNKEDKTLYEYMGEFKPVDIRHEVINVRDDVPINMDVLVTHHGPVITEDLSKGYGLALRYTALSEPVRVSECIFKMLSASDVDDLDSSMENWVDPCNNFVFADIHGDIGYLNRGKVPIRNMANAWLPVPGWTGEYEWQGFIPFDDLVRSKNPGTGYVVTANNRIAGKDYPYYMALNYSPEHRARRILDRLEVMQNATINDMSSIHAERVSIPALIYRDLLIRLKPKDNFVRKALEKLIKWNGSMDADEVAPTIYSAFRCRLDELIINHVHGLDAIKIISGSGIGNDTHLSRLSNLSVEMCEKNDISFLPKGETWASFSIKVFIESISELRDRLGDNIDSWLWGRLHYTRHRHTLSDYHPKMSALLDPPSVPMGGDGDTPQAAAYSSSEHFVMTSASVARYIFDTSDWGNSSWVVPLGSSGHPGSKHYADQMSLWSQVDLIPMLYDWDIIEKSCDSNQILTPK